MSIEFMAPEVDELRPRILAPRILRRDFLSPFGHQWGVGRLPFRGRCDTRPDTAEWARRTTDRELSREHVGDCRG